MCGTRSAVGSVGTESRGGTAPKVREGRGDVGATSAAGDRGLMSAEVWFDGRAGGSGEEGAKQAAEAAGKLQRTKARGRVRAGGLNDPDKQVHRGSQDVGKEGGVRGGRMYGLRQKVSDDVAGKM